jgi:HlyD family secretion protein
MFRKEALNRLSSPEQLDEVMRITSPRAWALIVSLVILLGCAVVWSVFGTITTRVAGAGMIVKGSGTLDLVSLASGQLSAVYAEVGHEVQQGEIVARIAQPDLAQQIEHERSKLADMRLQHERLIKLGTTGEAAYSGYVSEERGAFRAAVKGARERLAVAQEREKQQQELYKRGLVTKQTLDATRNEIRSASEAISQATAQMSGLSASTEETRGRKEKEVLASELRISDEERELAHLAERLELTSRVVSPHTGRVVEVRARVGDVVGPGRPILDLEPLGSEGIGLEALVYVPLAKGKTIRPGMRAQIAPDSVRKEEYGVMVGLVTSVSEFPSTEEGMKRVLGNDLLVKNLLETVGLAPVAVRVELVPDAHTKSGYRWSSREGPTLLIGPGTPCHATVSIRSTHPIELVVPLLRELVGVTS